jgi:hypothetical protein
MTAKLSKLLFIDEAKSDKIKAALLAKYPNDLEAVNKVLAANMLGPATWFETMALWSANKSEPIGETISAVASWIKNREKLGDLSKFKTTDELRGALNDLTSKSAARKQADAAKAETDRVYEDKQYLVVFAKSKEASCAYGSGTTWCTAATTKGNMFYPYARGGVWLYYIINKLSDPREDPYAKMSIGFDHAGAISWGRDGGLSVNAKNTGLKPTVVEDYLGDKFEPIMSAIKRHYKTNRGHEYEKDASEAHPALENYRRLINNPAMLKPELDKLLAAKNDDAMIDYLKGLESVREYNPDSVNLFFDTMQAWGGIEDAAEGYHYSRHNQPQLFVKFFKNHPEARKDERIWNHVLRMINNPAYRDKDFLYGLLQFFCETLRPEALLVLMSFDHRFTVTVGADMINPFMKSEIVENNPSMFRSRYEEFADRYGKHRTPEEIVKFARAVANHQQLNAPNKLLFCNELLSSLLRGDDDDGVADYSTTGAKEIADLCMDFILSSKEELPAEVNERPAAILGSASPEKLIQLLSDDAHKYWLYENSGYRLRTVLWNLGIKKDLPPETQNMVAQYVMQPAIGKLGNVGRRDIVRLMLGNYKDLTPENRQILTDYYQPNKPEPRLYEALFGSNRRV